MQQRQQLRVQEVTRQVQGSLQVGSGEDRFLASPDPLDSQAIEELYVFVRLEVLIATASAVDWISHFGEIVLFISTGPSSFRRHSPKF